MTNLSIVIRASNLVPVCPIARKLVVLQADNHPSVFGASVDPVCPIFLEIVVG